MTFTHTTTAGKTYHLNKRMTRSGAGKEYPFYFFSSSHKPETAVTEIPAGYEVAESNNMPILRKIKPVA